MTGTAPWMLVNAVFLQLAAFTDGPDGFSVPEGNAIASYMALAIQVGNVVTIGYVFASRIVRFDLRKVILAVLVLEILTTVALSMAWDASTSLLGSRVSIVLILASFASGVVGSMSNVTFWPYATGYCAEMTGAMALGTSFSNIIPSIIAAAQLPGSTPRFAPSLFFTIIGLMLVLATVSFFLAAWTGLASAALDTILDSTELGAEDKGRELTIPLLPPHRSVGLMPVAEAVLPRRRASCPAYTVEDRSHYPCYHGVITDFPGASHQNPKEPAKTFNGAATGSNSWQRRSNAAVDEGRKAKRHEPGKDRTNKIRILVNEASKTHGGSNGCAGPPPVVSPWCLPVLMQLWSCMMYFYIPGMQTFLVKDFPSKGSVLLWFTIVDKCVGVVGRYAASRSTSLVRDSSCCIVQTIAFFSLFILGWPMSISSIGLIIASAIHSILYSYTNTLLYCDNVRKTKDKSKAKQMSEWLGIAQQCGASVGIGIAFIQTISGMFD